MLTRAAAVVAMMLVPLLANSVMAAPVSDTCNINKDPIYKAALQSLMVGMDQALFTKEGKVSNEGFVYLTRNELAWGGGIGESLCYAGIMRKYIGDANRCPTYSAPEVPGSWPFCSYKNMVVKARFKPELLAFRSCPSSMQEPGCKYEATSSWSKTWYVKGNVKVSGTIMKAVNVESSVEGGVTTEVKVEEKNAHMMKPGTSASLFGVTIVLETSVGEISVASVVDPATGKCQPGQNSGGNVINKYVLNNKSITVWTSLVCKAATDEVIDKRQDQAQQPPADNNDTPSPAPTSPLTNNCFYYDPQTETFMDEPCLSDDTAA
ncbi:hypothetical protein BG015_001277 [Linnemannia schmuckeri]|uniref:Uncharacterized protein n=1 Tax=Linnemannia schmuckeri TaxID=64567 RepID=A0A9P5RPZ9_9FUNG|nr:hypothetical protein BG015_001277 [Linnemannia schmuckeri]